MVNAPETNDGGKNIWIAAGDGDLARVRELIEGGVSPNAKDENTYTPMHAAASWGHLEVLRYLHSQGGDINLADEDGDTPLFVAESVEAVKVILELGGELSHRNQEGQTASDFVEDEYPEVAEYLRSLEGSVLSVPAGRSPDPTDALSSNLLLHAQNIMRQAEASGTQNSPGVDAALRRVVEEAIEGSVEAGRATAAQHVCGGAEVGSATTPENESTKRKRIE